MKALSKHIGTSLETIHIRQIKALMPVQHFYAKQPSKNPKIVWSDSEELYVNKSPPS